MFAHVEVPGLCCDSQTINISAVTTIHTVQGERTILIKYPKMSVPVRRFDKLNLWDSDSVFLGSFNLGYQ